MFNINSSLIKRENVNTISFYKSFLIKTLLFFISLNLINAYNKL